MDHRFFHVPQYSSSFSYESDFLHFIYHSEVFKVQGLRQGLSILLDRRILGRDESGHILRRVQDAQQGGEVLFSLLFQTFDFET